MANFLQVGMARSDEQTEKRPPSLPKEECKKCSAKIGEIEESGPPQTKVRD
jgi:hypothetical protein